MDNVFIERLWCSLQPCSMRTSTSRATSTAATRVPESAQESHSTTARPHQALDNRTPMEAWRGGVTGVDMTLRLDNARALPTCLQPSQVELA
jgi:hypothetical protein